MLMVFWLEVFETMVGSEDTRSGGMEDDSDWDTSAKRKPGEMKGMEDAYGGGGESGFGKLPGSTPKAGPNGGDMSQDTRKKWCCGARLVLALVLFFCMTFLLIYERMNTAGGGQAVHYGLHTVHCTLCNVHYTLYTMHYALWTVHYALCTIHYAVYTMHYALCTMDYAVCTAYTAFTPYKHTAGVESRLAVPSLPHTIAHFSLAALFSRHTFFSLHFSLAALFSGVSRHTSSLHL
jgi:hypothetical protein